VWDIYVQLGLDVGGCRVIISTGGNRKPNILAMAELALRQTAWGVVFDRYRYNRFFKMRLVLPIRLECTRPSASVLFREETSKGLHP